MAQNYKKRANGEGSIRQRPDGRWEARLMAGHQANGRPRIKSFYGKTQKEVYVKMTVYQEALAQNLNLEDHYTFETWADVWFESHKPDITVATQQHYSYILATLKRALGPRLLYDIKAYDIERFLRGLRQEGRSDSYLASSRGLLYQIFNKAEANDLILKNPVRFAEKMRSPRDAPKRKEAFNAEEVKLLMEHLPQSKMGLSIRLMLGTGMRTQELLALEPQHIAEDGSLICIRQALVKIKGSVAIGPPKSRDSYRNIPVPANLRYCAAALRDTPDQFIWEGRKEGQPCNPSYFSRLFKETLGQIDGVRVLTPHCCRHTYVSQMQALGVDLSTIQSLVGHAQVDMTEHYLHVQDSIREEAINKFSNAFGQSDGTTLHVV